MIGIEDIEDVRIPEMERKNEKKFYLITSNHHKLKEFEIGLKRAGILVKQIKMKLVEPQANTLEEVAKFKARQAYEKIKKPVLVEDSGLFIHALNGFPGVYSSYVFKTIGNEGILKLMEGKENREATFKSVVALALGKNDIKLFVGECNGMISEKARGKAGFGFDPIFIPAGHDKTFAEDYEMKNKLSHRKQAIQKLVEFLKSHNLL